MTNLLNDVFKELDEVFANPVNKEWLDNITCADDMIKLHMTLGRKLRSEYFWIESDLKKHLQSLGIQHPDSMSGYVLKEYWKYANKK